MTDAIVMDIARQGVIVGLMIVLPVLAVSLFFGLAVSVFQAVTQVQEMTLTFVPKVVGTAILLLLMGGWMLTTLVNFTHVCFEQATAVGKSEP